MEDIDLKELLRFLSNLRHVDFSGNSDLKDITFLCDKIHLETLTLHQCVSIDHVPLLCTIVSLRHLSR